MADAHVFDKSGDQIIVMHTRRHLVQPIRADGWIDLRVGWFLSLTTSGADDTITGLSETIASIGNVNPADSRYFIGLKTEGDNLPLTGSEVFIGFSNSQAGGPNREQGASKLLSSDIGIGTTNSNFWRPDNDYGVIPTGVILEGANLRRAMTQNFPHFVQNVGGAGGYATMLAMRLQRDNPSSRTVRVSFPQNVNSADVEFSSTPTKAELLDKLVNFPASVFNMAAVELSRVPTAWFFFWPFQNSRLRFHAFEVVEVA